MHWTKHTQGRTHTTVFHSLQPTGLILGLSAPRRCWATGRHSSGNCLTGGNVAFSDAQRTRRRRTTAPVWDKERCVRAAGSAAKIVEMREQRRAHGCAIEPSPRGRMVAVAVLRAKGQLLVLEDKRNGRLSDVGELISGFGLVARGPRTPMAIAESV